MKDCDEYPTTTTTEKYELLFYHTFHAKTFWCCFFLSCNEQQSKYNNCIFHVAVIVICCR